MWPTGESKEVATAALSNIQKAVRKIIETVEEVAPQAKGTPNHEAS